MHCPHCGGVVGRDCFNVEECGAITQEIERQGMIDAELEPLRAQLEAEREAHAAEAARLRATLRDARGAVEALHKQGLFGVNSGWAFSMATGTVADINAALAAPPTAAAQAVEGMRKALEAAADDLEGCWQADLYRENAEAARAALAAWKEATRG